MSLFKKIILVSLLLLSMGLVTTSFSNSAFEEGMDNSKHLHNYLEKQARHLDYPYTFDVYKKDDYYKVIIKFQNQETTKKIPQAYVDKFFDEHDRSYGESIVDIIFIPGKK